MKIANLLNESTICDSVMDEVLNCHPKQILNEELEIPVWKITYRYLTRRGNEKTAVKYIFLDEYSWDRIDQFKLVKEDIRAEKQVSNVQILDAKFLGKLYIPLE